MVRPDMDDGKRKSWKILVADDNRNVNQVVRDTLNEYGFEVVQSFDGKNALATFDEHKPDLTFLDYLMPEIDGLDVLNGERFSCHGRRRPTLTT